ncbi:hypothetical protein [Thiolapillus sp.]
MRSPTLRFAPPGPAFGRLMIKSLRNRWQVTSLICLLYGRLYHAA